MGKNRKRKVLHDDKNKLLVFIILLTADNIEAIYNGEPQIKAQFNNDCNILLSQE